MNKLTKRISNFVLSLIALTSLFIALPVAMEIIEILIISTSTLFIGLVILITLQISKLEEKIGELNKNFKIIERLNRLELEVF